jgi:hypothetical protein
MLETEASRERWSVRLAFLALGISVCALLVTYLQWRSSERAVQVAEQARQDAVTEAERQRIDAKNTLDQQRRDASAALEAQTKRADRANTLADRSAEAAEKTAKTAAQQLELGDRSWVKVTEVKPRGTHTILSLSFQDISQRKVPGLQYQVTLNYEIQLKVIGRSPALNIDVWQELYLAPWGNNIAYPNEVADEENRACDEFAKRKKEIKNAGTAAFPDETPIVYQGAAAIVSKETKVQFSDAPGDYILPVLIGCVDYQFQSSDRHHQTRFVYETFHGHEPRTRFFLIGEDVSATDLVLIRNKSDDYAY